MPRRRPHLPPLADPHRVADVFASGFETYDWEDWLRLVCWAEHLEGGDGDGLALSERRIAARVVLPRAAVPSLIRLLRQSVAHHREPARH